MKYTRLFNTHADYVAYTGGTDFIKPNVSWCISEDEAHCTPSDYCEEGHTYEVIGNPSYPSSVPATATSFSLSFNYNDIYTTIACVETVTSSSDTVTIAIEENLTTSARTVSGTYYFHEIGIQYSLTQEASQVIPYNQQYLTFDVLTGGTILWMAHNGTTKTISYSKNNGSSWTEITSTAEGVAINVSAGDKVLVKGTNSQYGSTNNKDNYSGFNGGTAKYNVQGNAMSLIGGDNFTGLTTFSEGWVFKSLFDHANVVSAANLVLPVTTLTQHCYRAMFANATNLIEAPELPATTLANNCYYYMFENCAITTAPTLSATTLGAGSYYGMFTACTSLSAITCLATNITANTCTNNWVHGVAASGVFTKASSMTSWTTGDSGIPSGWIVQNDGVESPTISCDGEHVTIVCNTPSVDIYYRLDSVGNFVQYSNTIVITADTVVEAYSELNGETSTTVTETCVYSPIILVSPVITCDGEHVRIVCETLGATIYYRIDQGSYAQYVSQISITADTVVSAYSSLDGKVSTVVTENCKYNPVHNYENDYLTLDVITSGTILWKQVGNYSSTISYSLNNGTSWTQITSTTAGTAINVSAGDKVLVKGTNQKYASDKNNYSAFESGGTATFNAEGNIMSLIYGDNFSGQTTFNGGTYNFCSFFKQSNVVSAEHLILPATILTQHCYRAMFSKCHSLTKVPELPAMTLADSCYWYMFEECLITSAPDLPATTLVAGCYGHMFTGCTNLNYIRCLATTGFTANNALTNWVNNVAATGTFIKDENTTWASGASGIPNGWTVYDYSALASPVISYDGFDTITMTCSSSGAKIYYDLDQSGVFTEYSSAITISADTLVEAYSELGQETSVPTSKNCIYVSDVPIEASNRSLNNWKYSNQPITTPYSINAIDGHSSNYARGTFNFETTFALREAQPTYLWFQHADQTASVYIDNTLVEKHWGGYNAFFTDITNYVHSGTNNVTVAITNNEGNNLAPAAGDFNFNATLGNVRLFTSPYLPSMSYGYDGFHITSTVSSASATVYVKTNIPTGASVVCTISGTNCNYTATSASTGNEMIFTTTITNPHLWDGTVDPYLYNVKLEIYHNNELYHRYVRPYGLRFYEYVINDTVKYGTAGSPYTGFLLNGHPYLLRGVCMHDDLAGKANALTTADYTQEFNIIRELGCNFIRLAHYPHPKEVYDKCDEFGIVVQTEVPCVNKMQSTMPSDYYTHLNGQYEDMVNQHYNHPCIMFWGLSNETTTDDKSFAKTKIEGYTSLIKSLDSERLVGYVISHSYDDPSGYYNDPAVDWFGCNLYVGWYIDQDSNNPTNRLNTRITKTITNKNKPLAFSEYGAGGTQHCHSDEFMTTTTRGNNARHDIEYQMWLHEGHIAAIKNFPQLMFTGQWQLFDIAVYNRTEGYTVCLDGENTSTDENLKRLNNKGLVERDHVTKKDTFYLYKAWWNPTPFVHICGKDYTKTSSRVIKCYTNDGNSLSLYVNNTFIETVSVTDNIATFTARNFSSNDVVRVNGSTTNDTFTFS